MIEETLCPDCNGKMTSRMNRSTGQRFWGCNDYPRCHGTRDTDGEAPARSRNASEIDTLPSESPSDRQRGNDRSRWRNQ